MKMNHNVPCSGIGRGNSTTVNVVVIVVVMMVVLSVVTIIQVQYSIRLLPLGYNVHIKETEKQIKTSASTTNGSYQQHQENDNHHKIYGNMEGHPLTTSLFWFGSDHKDTNHTTTTTTTSWIDNNEDADDDDWGERNMSTSCSPWLWHHNDNGDNSSNSNINNNNTIHSILHRQHKQQRQSPLKSKPPLTQIVVLGERHSGTTFVTKYLQDCFQSNGSSDNNIIVTDRFVNTKHWFQPSPEYVVSAVLNDNNRDRAQFSSSSTSSTTKMASSTSITTTTTTSQQYHMNKNVAISNNLDIDLDWWTNIVVGGTNKGGGDSNNNNNMTRNGNENVRYEYHDDGNDNNNATTTTTTTTETETKLQFDKFVQLAKRFFDSSLVIVLVRDPYDWLEAMRRKPWHWPNHIDLYPNVSSTTGSKQNSKEVTVIGGVHGHRRRSRPKRKSRKLSQSLQKSYVGYDLLEWNEFVSRPMYLLGAATDNGESDSNSHIDDDDNNTDITSISSSLSSSSLVMCQKGIPVGYVSPCQRNKTFVPESLQGKIPKTFMRHLPFDTNDPVYEMDMTKTAQVNLTMTTNHHHHHLHQHKSFDHPLQLRSSKIRNMISIPEQWNVAGFVIVQYERLFDGGMEEFIKELSVAMNIKNDSSLPHCPDNKPFMRQRPYNLSQEFTKWINSNAAWDTETSIGYNKYKCS